MPAFIDQNDGSWNDASDISLKEDILPDKPVLADIKRLKVSTYHCKTNATGHRSFGLIAQDVAQYFPEIVSGIQGKDGHKLWASLMVKQACLLSKPSRNNS